MEQFKTDIIYTKGKFIKFIKKLNEYNKINNSIITDDMKEHLNILIQLWRNVKDNNYNNIDYYFNMKDHHSHINGRIKNEILKEYWDDYLNSGLKFRLKLIEYQHTHTINNN